MSGIKVIEASWSTHEQILSAIRREVFIIEQKVPEELEWDGLDEKCIHVLAQDLSKGYSKTMRHQAIGTGRLVLASQTEKVGHIGRMAIRKEYRRKGVGNNILQHLVELANREGIGTLFLNAQVYVVDFYQKAGFSSVGNTFMDAGIPHVKMTFKL